MLRFTAEDCRKKREEENLDRNKKVEKEATDLAESIAEKIHNTEGCYEELFVVDATNKDLQNAIMAKTIELLIAEDVGFKAITIEKNVIKVSIK